MNISTIITLGDRSGRWMEKELPRCTHSFILCKCETNNISLARIYACRNSLFNLGLTPLVSLMSHASSLHCIPNCMPGTLRIVLQHGRCSFVATIRLSFKAERGGKTGCCAYICACEKFHAPATALSRI